MHPNAIDLQAFACGDDAPHVASHLADCDACNAYVARAGGLAKEAPRAKLPTLDATVTAIGSRRSKIALAIAPFAAAAAVLLWMGTREPVATLPAANATSPRATAPPTALAINDTPDPDTTFKGGIQVAVVRERKGVQDRFTNAVRVRPGDRLRIEVALDRSQTILGAVMGEDGSYVELMPAGVRDAGTHFSEKATRVDEHPLRGTILVGTPEAVRLARSTHDFGGHDLAGLRTLPIEWEAP
ncbi:MAG: hypothetical protein JWM74_4953 [Myxococcaceae bacterium]|jgi:hypothetical protein|nr:hypothetical protein [Myxococcaceae bacterium]